MNARRAIVIALVAAACGIGGARAQDAPIAGSGELPAIDPDARAPAAVVEAVMKMLSNRAQNRPFREIKACFRRVGPDDVGLIGCRRDLDRYFTEVRRTRDDLLGGLSPLEVYARLADLSGDPDGKHFARDVYSLRGLLVTVDEARHFREIRWCFRDAGPQPAMRQICRQRLHRFDIELIGAHPILFRDLDRDLIRKRLFQVADADNRVFGLGETPAYESLRRIREAQQRKRTEAAREMAVARRYYCAASQSRRLQSLETEMTSDGVCLCTYGRRFVGSDPSVRGRPVRAGYASCGAASRFRVVDLDGGYLTHGDWVALRAAHGGYASLHGNGYLYADQPEIGKFEKFRVVRANGRAGRIQPGELVTLVSPRGGYVTTNLKGGGVLRGGRTELKPYEYFVFVR